MVMNSNFLHDENTSPFDFIAKITKCGKSRIDHDFSSKSFPNQFPCWRPSGLKQKLGILKHPLKIKMDVDESETTAACVIFISCALRLKG